MTIPLSVLDLAHITEGSTAAEALRRSLDLAQHAERLGGRRSVERTRFVVRSQSPQLHDDERRPPFPRPTPA